jgi:T-complex protein 1 subunit epsilon
VYGGGAAEISSSIAVAKAADEIPSIEQYAMRAFASALDQIPLALAENSGLSPIDSLAAVKSRQVTEKNYRLGIDCVGAGDNDMKKQHVFDPLMSKRQQYLLATQLVRAVLKVSFRWFVALRVYSRANSLALFSNTIRLTTSLPSTSIRKRQ